jgi:hypothetical protein
MEWKSVYITTAFATKLVVKLLSFIEIYFHCGFNTGTFVIEIKGESGWGSVPSPRIF